MAKVVLVASALQIIELRSDIQSIRNILNRGKVGEKSSHNVHLIMRSKNKDKKFVATLIVLIESQ